MAAASAAAMQREGHIPPPPCKRTNTRSACRSLPRDHTHEERPQRQMQSSVAGMGGGASWNDRRWGEEMGFTNAFTHCPHARTVVVNHAREHRDAHHRHQPGPGAHWRCWTYYVAADAPTLRAGRWAVRRHTTAHLHTNVGPYGEQGLGRSAGSRGCQQQGGGGTLRGRGASHPTATVDGAPSLPTNNQ